MRNRLLTNQINTTGVLVLNGGADDDMGAMTPQNWVSIRLAETQLSGVLSGEGSYANLTYGHDLSVSDTRISGVSISVEQGDWAFDADADVEKEGVGFGAYTVRRSGRMVLSAAIELMEFDNRFTSTSDATAQTSSSRTSANVSLSYDSPLENGATVIRYAEVGFSSERINGYTYSDGTTIEATTAEAGQISLGIQVYGPLQENGGQYLFGAQIADSFGTDEITLSNGTIYSPTDTRDGSITLGYSRPLGEDRRMGWSITASGLGNDEVSETQVEGWIDRQY